MPQKACMAKGTHWALIQLKGRLAVSTDEINILLGLASNVRWRSVCGCVWKGPFAAKDPSLGNEPFFYQFLGIVMM